MKNSGGDAQGAGLNERAAAIRRRFSTMSAKMEVQPIGSAPLKAPSRASSSMFSAALKVSRYRCRHFAS